MKMYSHVSFLQVSIEFQHGLGELDLKLTHYSQGALYGMVSVIMTIIVSGDDLLPIWHQALLSVAPSKTYFNKL